MSSNQHTRKSEPSAYSNVFSFRRLPITLRRMVDGSSQGRKAEHTPTLLHEVSSRNPKKRYNWIKKHKKLQKRNASRRDTIEILPADVLVKIFDAYRLDPLIHSQLEGRPWKWQKLAHVCKTWRSVLLASSHYLGLRLFFTSGMPVREVLSSWPVLPIVIQYVEAPGSSPLTLRDQDNIISLLELTTRLRSVQLTVSTPLLERLTTLMQQPFAELEHLHLSTPPGLVLPSEVGGGMPRLRALRLVGTSLPALPQLLLSAHDLVSLQLEQLPSVGYTLEALIICLPAMTRLKTIRIHFVAPTSRPVLITTDQPLPGFSVLPVLDSIEFRGTSEYLESLLSGISAPLLEKFHIDFFNQLIFDTPQLSRFICRTEMQRSHAAIHSSVTDISITLTQPGVPHQLSLRISSKQLDWQIPAMAEVCDRFSSTLTDVEQLEISTSASFPDGQDDRDDIHSEILGIFRPFHNVRRLCVTEGSLSLVAGALRLVTGELAIVTLPELQEIQTKKFAELYSAQTSLAPFIAARRRSIRPIQVKSVPQNVQHFRGSPLTRSAPLARFRQLTRSAPLARSPSPTGSAPLVRSAPLARPPSPTGPPLPTRSQAHATRFHTHPLLSYTRLRHAPISYDIAFTPSGRTVVDRTIHAPVPAVTLAQPATEPPIPASSQLVLRSPKLPWTVAVGPIGSPPSFFIGNGGRQRKATTSAALTNLDVLYAVHTTLMTRVTPEEWAALGEGSRAQRRVAEAYKQRCTRMGGGWEGGVRRVDWLGSKTHLVGVEIDQSNEAGEGAGRLVFGKA